jgi:hypothetical protein
MPSLVASEAYLAILYSPRIEKTQKKIGMSSVRSKNNIQTKY